MNRRIVAALAVAIAAGLHPTAAGAAGLTPAAASRWPVLGAVQAVYPGTDGGVSCGTATERIEARPGDPVTWCFTVTNQGGGWLGAIMIADPALGIQPTPMALDGQALTGGQSIQYYLEGTVPDDRADGISDGVSVNLALATASPLDAASHPVPGAALLSTGTRTEVQLAASVSLASSLYAGRDSGAGCPGTPVAAAVPDTPLSVCLDVTNTGGTSLSSIGFSSLGLPGTPRLLAGGPLPLAPGATATYLVETKAPAAGAAGLAVRPVVSATPVDERGAPLTGRLPVTATGRLMVGPPTATGSGQTGSTDRSRTSSTRRPTSGDGTAAADPVPAGTSFARPTLSNDPTDNQTRTAAAAWPAADTRAGARSSQTATERPAAAADRTGVPSGGVRSATGQTLRLTPGRDGAALAGGTRTADQILAAGGERGADGNGAGGPAGTGDGATTGTGRAPGQGRNGATIGTGAGAGAGGDEAAAAPSTAAGPNNQGVRARSATAVSPAANPRSLSWPVWLVVFAGVGLLASGWTTRGLQLDLSRIGQRRRRRPVDPGPDLLTGPADPESADPFAPDPFAPGPAILDPLPVHLRSQPGDGPPDPQHRP